jgi:hypothetical protein
VAFITPYCWLPHGLRDYPRSEAEWEGSAKVIPVLFQDAVLGSLLFLKLIDNLYSRFYSIFRLNLFS